MSDTTQHKLMRGVRPGLRKRKVPLGTPLPRPISGASGASGPGAYPDLLYYGGPVVPNPQVYIVFLGNWTGSSAQTRATDLQQFVSDFLSSSYMNTLGQYICGTNAKLVNSVFIANTNDNLSHDDLTNIFQTAINNGTIPEPTNRSNCCIMYLDDNTAVDDTTADIVMCETTSDTAFGYHDYFTTAAGNPFYFAIVPGLTNACLTNSCPGGDSTCTLQLSMTQEQRQTKVTSHEFSEMVTNPENTGVPATTNLAWIDQDIGTGEIGDICNDTIGTITVGSNTWTVQPIYSKWDDMNSNGATSCVYGDPNPLPCLLPACSLILERSTFGKDEVTSLLSGGKTLYSDALYVVVNGYTPAQLGLTSSNLNNPPNLSSLITFNGTFPGLSTQGVTIAFDGTTGVQLEDTTNLTGIQTITFPFNVQFQTVSGSLVAFNGVPANPGYQDYTLSATVASSAATGYPAVSATSTAAEIEFVLQADPYMVAGETFWLSNDMRVFTVTPATLKGSNPLKYSTTPWAATPNDYIANLIDELNTNFTDPTVANTPFNGVQSGEDQSALLLGQNDTSGNAVYNFGLARVHLQGDTASNVRMFFRLFISTSPDTDFNTSTTFRSLEETDSMGIPIPGTLIPMLGFPSSDMTSTIPFFAASRIVSTSASMTTQSDPKNVQTIPSPLIPTPPPPGQQVLAYFGCWLDLNQPTPQFPLNPAATATPNGPWLSSQIQSIPSIIMGNHACLVAEISYDPDPIPPGANAATSDKIGQRNLSWGPSDNPGSADAHRVPTLFDIRPTSAKLQPAALPDELMIEWGNTPARSIASIYWPQIEADQIIALAQRHYPLVNFTKADEHTIQCVTGAITYIPIPPGTGPNIAGLITLDLPQTILTGQEFQVVVRRLSTRSVGFDDANFRSLALSWRYVVGAFQINIPVGTSKTLLKPEESVLAVYKWKIEQIPATNRWYPVLQRFINQVAGRVAGLGGNPGSIQPTQTGGGSGQVGAGKALEYTGKVEGLIFDRFGDFEGFLLETEEGEHLTFAATEQAIEDRVREAWVDRMVISVFVEASDGRLPVLIILRRAPRPEHL
jgi:hypothetical protein